MIIFIWFLWMFAWTLEIKMCEASWDEKMSYLFSHSREWNIWVGDGFL